MTIRITWFRAFVALVGAVLLALLVSWSGVISVAASSGHWPITAWFLHWTMENSVRTHAALSAPDDVIADQELVSAAGHFAQSCASCHGAPGIRPLPVMQAATPHAPDLGGKAGEWTNAQLFWILEHGVKYSGMPAWAATDRPDEIRRMVAFVRALPTMTPQRYRELVGGAAGQPVVGLAAGTLARCTGCHGTDGRGRGQPDIPVLAGQKPAYLLAALKGYATGARSSAVMRQAAAQLHAGEMRALSAYFATRPGGLDAGGVARAAALEPQAHIIATRGLPEQQLPACLSCHDPARPTRYPIVHGQRATYVAGRLHRWRGKENVVDARKSHATMPVIARRIPEEMIEPLARYFEAAGSPAPARVR